MKKSERTKQKILQATIKTISQTGYAGTTTQEIAEEAGVSEGTVFKYYGTKEELLRQVVEDTLREFKDYTVNEALPEIIDQAGENAPQKLLYGLLKERAQFFNEHSAATQVIIQETMINRSVRETFSEEIWGEMERMSDRIFDQGKRQGMFRDVPNQLLRRVLFGAVFFQIIFEGMIGVNREDGEGIGDGLVETLEIILHGVMEGEK